MNHSPEPWIEDGFAVRDGDGHFITAEPQLNDLRRIVACVNACQGVPSEFLQTVIRAGFDKLIELYKRKHPDKCSEWLQNYVSPLDQ